jgi:hypothetical protein
MALLNPTGCFPGNEVLRRGVEVVELVNELIEEFR